MRFDVYCDESYPDLFASRNPQARYMTIGGLWLHSSQRQLFKEAIHALRDEYRIGGEFKWQKATPSKEMFYRRLARWFFEQEERLRFRCVAVDRQQVDLVRYHQSDQELGFYKFYYQLLHHWIFDFNDYLIFCDFKNNRHRDRLHVLQQCLNASNLSSRVLQVQAVRSSESVLIQLADLLTGAVAARLNDALRDDSAKGRVVGTIESCLGHPIQHTLRSEQKFNVFVIDLQGGW